MKRVNIEYIEVHIWVLPYCIQKTDFHMEYSGENDMAMTKVLFRQGMTYITFQIVEFPTPQTVPFQPGCCLWPPCWWNIHCIEPLLYQNINLVVAKSSEKSHYKNDPVIKVATYFHAQLSMIRKTSSYVKPLWRSCDIECNHMRLMQWVFCCVGLARESCYGYKSRRN